MKKMVKQSVHLVLVHLVALVALALEELEQQENDIAEIAQELVANPEKVKECKREVGRNQF